MLVAGLVFAWVHRARQQQAAVAALHKSNPGAVVLYERSHGNSVDSPSRVGAWLSKRLGVDYVHNVAGVELQYPTDADIERLAALPQVRRLVLLRSVDLTDKGLERLATCTNLRQLVLLDAEQVTDAGVLQLGRLKNLEYLQLDLGRHQPSAEVIQSLRRALPRCKMEIAPIADVAVAQN